MLYLETLPVPFIRADRQGEIVFANLAAREFFGHDVVGQPIYFLYAAASDLRYSDPENVKEDLLCCPDKRLLNVLVPLTLHDGSIREALCSFTWDKVSDCIDTIILEGSPDLSQALLQISESLVRPGNWKETLAAITTQARKLSRAERAYLKLYDPLKDLLVFHALSSVDPLEVLPESSSSTTRGMTGHVFASRLTYRSNDVSNEPPGLYYNLFPGTASKVVVPLVHSFTEEGEPPVCYGVLSVDGRRPNQFGLETVEVLEALARHAAVAIAQARLMSETKTTYAELIKGMRASQDATLALNILHDGKNMVRGVVHLLESIIDESIDKPFMRRRQQELKARLDKLRDLMDTIGDIARSLRESSNRYSDASSFEPVDLVKLAEKVARIVPIADLLIEIQVIREIEPCKVYGHKTLLMLMLYNLVINAVDAMSGSAKAGGVKILLANSPKRSFRRLQIIDEGPGLSRNVLRLLRHADHYPSTPGGIGVGLLTVLESVKDLNGFLTVDSKLGSGTKFTIDLPGP